MFSGSSAEGDKGNPDKKSRVDGDTSSVAVVSKVLDDVDLLNEILLRVGFPTTLVRAALVCRRWFYHVSDHAFLRSFRKLHPPRLLGFYIDTESEVSGLPCFVPMLPHPPELDAVIRRARSSFDRYQSDSSSTRIMNCRNGSVLIDHDNGKESTLGLHSLLFPERGMTIIPPCPPAQVPEGEFYVCSTILTKEEGGLSNLVVMMQSCRDRKYKFHVYKLQDGVLCMHSNLYIEQVLPLLSDPNDVLVGSKIYMLAAANNIVVLDLTTSSFSMVQLPTGVEYGVRNVILSQADDTVGVYLIHVDQLQLRVWLHNNGDNWLLVDTICFREICANSSFLDCSYLPQIMQAGDNAEFVFLEMGRYLLHLDIKRRKMRKVYEVTEDNTWLDDIYPFMMIWPPTFPALKDDPSRNAM